MSEIELGYGPGSLRFAFDEERYRVLGANTAADHPLSDFEIGEALDAPIGSPALEEIVSAGESVLITVSDATRATASAQVVNLLVRRLIQGGISPGDIAAIFATGIHRPVTHAEKLSLLTPFIVQRIRTIDHDAYDSRPLELGMMAGGEPMEVNPALREFDLVIITGAVGFHYFAGFTGGRKSICPGLASAKTIAATHRLVLDYERGGRRPGVGTGLLTGNAVHEACDFVAEQVSPAFNISTVVDEQGRAVRVYAGHWRASHRLACDEYLQQHRIELEAKRDLVVASCGGFPWDINLIQAHKSLEMAAQACHEGGTIVLLAQCKDGLGRSDFLKWFAARNSGELEARLREGYEVNGQTAWSLLTKAERYRVYLVSSLEPEDVRLMRMTPVASLAEALRQVDAPLQGYIMPRAPARLPVPKD